MNVDRILAFGDLHIWQFRTDAAQDHERLRAKLSPAELARSERFVRDADGRQFVISHGALRSILGDYLGVPAAAVAFGCTGTGKPFLVSMPGLHFNLTHSADFAAVAVARTPVGIDIEQIRPLDDAREIASHYFSAAECDALEKLPEGERLRAFYRCWTRKEAYVKARGEGLSLPLDGFSVSLTEDLPAVVHSDFGPAETGRWKLGGVHPAAGYAGAVAVEGSWRNRADRFWSAPESGAGKTTGLAAWNSWRAMEVNFLV
jgi:4'-phosphopantetheinyl transferase